MVEQTAGNVVQGLALAQPDPQNLADFHAFEAKLGAHEGHRADFARNIEFVVDGQRPVLLLFFFWLWKACHFQ